MEYLRVLFILSATFTAWVNAGRIFGYNTSGNEKLVTASTRINRATYVTFNTNHAYKLTIDKVDLQFYSGGAVCYIVSGGPFNRGMNIKVTPTDYSRQQGTSLTVVVYGRWQRGERTQIVSSAIGFS